LRRMRRWLGGSLPLELAHDLVEESEGFGFGLNVLAVVGLR
jgi:hypothetical protein